MPVTDKNQLALLMLESPWATPKADPLRKSVLPFVKALESSNRCFRTYYATFYDTAGFSVALEQDLRHTFEERQVLYIAAHGSRGQIGNGRASSILSAVHKLAPKVKGIIIGSCEVADQLKNLEKALAGNVRWVFGYSVAIDWLNSTLVDIAIIDAIATLNDEHDFDTNEEILIGAFAFALSRFSPDHILGDDTPICECIHLLHKPKHARNAVDLTEKLIAATWGAGN